jgi:tetratricopeptide (TPR) repeat protein
MRKLVVLILLAGCANSRPEAISLLGKPLRAPVLGSETRQERTALLDAARRAWEKNPRSANAIIWLGRRTAYLARYRDAIDIYSRGIALHPSDARLLRHRGHRYITIRDFERAVVDLSAAARLVEGQSDHVEPDGLPNARKIPTSTLHFNIWYHLGLAHYLRGDFSLAANAYARCMSVSKNADSRLAAGHWYYMTLRRLGNVKEAATLLAQLDSEEEVFESHSYRDLIRMYEGTRSAEELAKVEGDLDRATIGYGLGNWFLVNGQTERAVTFFEDVMSLDEWAAFGFIASEADLARIRGAGEPTQKATQSPAK